jgi:hypothetical protein
MLVEHCAALLDWSGRQDVASSPSEHTPADPLNTIVGVAGEIDFNWSTSRPRSGLGIGRSASTRSIPPDFIADSKARVGTSDHAVALSFEHHLVDGKSVRLRQRRESGFGFISLPAALHGNTCPNAPEQTCQSWRVRQLPEKLS